MISPLLRNLQNVDLIIKHNKRYRIIDPVLAICFVSVARFREEALRFATKSGAWCMDLKMLNALLKKYGMRRVEEV